MPINYKAQRLLLKRGSGSPSSIFYEGEPIYDYLNKTLYIGNQGGSGSGYGSPVASYSAYTASSTMLVSQSTNVAASLKLFESSSNGSNYVTITSPTSLTENITLTLPNQTGTSGQFLKTSGSGTLIWGDETDTLDSITDRGNTTTNTLNVGSIVSTGSVTSGGYQLVNGVPTFIQDTQPTLSQLNGLTKYIWWDTSDGNLTLWVEDGN